MSEIAINIGAQQGHHEIDFSGTVAQFASLSCQLTNASTEIIPLKHKPNPFFPQSISRLWVELVSQSDGVISAQINGAEFKLVGDSQAFRKLAEFLDSLSALRSGEHFHLDWFSNKDLLAPTTSDMSFIFSVEM